MSEVNGQLPAGWCLAKVEDVILECQYGSSAKTSEQPDGVPVLRMGNIQDGRLDLSELKYLPASHSEFPKLLLRDGDLLFNRTNSVELVGKSAVYSGNPSRCSYASYLVALRFGETCESKYLCFYINSHSGRQWIRSVVSQQVGQANVNSTKLRALQFPIAPLNEQRRIVGKIEELFSDLEAGVAALTRARGNLKRYRASVLKAAVEGSLTADWRAANLPLPLGEGRGEGLKGKETLIRPSATFSQGEKAEIEPAARLLERILQERRRQWEADQLAKFTASGKPPPKNWQAKYPEPSPPDLTDVPEIPDGWTIASVDQLTTTITSGSRDWSQFYGEGTGTFIMAQNVRPGRLDLSFRQAVDPPTNDRDRVRSQVLDGDLLVTIVGANTGDVCRVDGNFPEHYVCQSVALMRLVNPVLSPFVEAYFVSHENGQRQFRRYIYGQGRPHLGFDQLRVTPVLLPPLAEQQQIVAEVAEKLSQIEAAEVAIEHGLRRAARLRQSILKQAFEGKLVPQDPTDEPASTLLERVKLSASKAVRR